MNQNPQIEYIADASVDDALDLELRSLLCTCFTGPQDHVFKTRRYFNEPPAHRWMIRNETGGLVAHIAVHEKRLITDQGVTYRIGGIAEVCVHPTHQGRGYVKRLVGAAHDWMRLNGFSFSVLSGSPRNYASSGYLPVEGLFIDGEAEAGAPPPRIKAPGALVVCLSPEPWPEGETYIPGVYF